MPQHVGRHLGGQQQQLAGHVRPGTQPGLVLRRQAQQPVDAAAAQHQFEAVAQRASQPGLDDGGRAEALDDVGEVLLQPRGQLQRRLHHLLRLALAAGQVAQHAQLQAEREGTLLGGIVQVARQPVALLRRRQCLLDLDHLAQRIGHAVETLRQPAQFVAAMIVDAQREIAGGGLGRAAGATDAADQQHGHGQRRHGADDQQIAQQVQQFPAREAAEHG